MRPFLLGKMKLHLTWLMYKHFQALNWCYFRRKGMQCTEKGELLIPLSCEDEIRI
uniref:Uncharacterized protein n=1 Tax=Anguilla anguilla TaxID=7936 RepID=A0A0E9S4L5_ANGAN